MATEATRAVVPIYEERLRNEWDWAMDEGDRFFRGEDAVFQTMRKIARRLDDLGIPYVVVGAMALNAHGFRRLTVDVDLLVTREGLKAIHDQLEGLGYLPPFQGSKHLRDTEHGVRVEFLVAGEYPGDGKPKPVAFPDPAEGGVVREGIKFLRLSSLMELKLASGMTNPGRLKDLGDVQEVIKVLDLPADFAEQLNPFVRAKFSELWNGVQQGRREP